MAEIPRIPIETLETERLRLRPLEEGDASRIQALLPNPNVMRYLTKAMPWPYPDDGAKKFLGRTLPRIAAGEEYVWAILLKGREAEGLIGVISLDPAAEGSHRGFWLGEPYWGQGLMREAAAAVTDFAFDRLGMAELRLDNAEPNVASDRLKASAGAEIVSTGEADYVGGRFREVRWRLTAEAWRRSRRP